MAGEADPGESTSLAEAYDRHVGRYRGQLAARLIEVAGVRAGQRALDVGCGPGPLTTVLAELLGGEHVAAVDPFEAFVEACRDRVPGADVRVSTGEILVEADYGSFDELFRPFEAGAGHSGACFGSLDEVSQRSLRDQAFTRLGEPEGPFTLTARAWWVRGLSPAS